MAKVVENARIIANREIAPGIWNMRLDCSDVATLVLPGQFVHVRVPEYSVQTLRMPFCVYDASADAGWFEICYQVLGDGTEQLTSLGADDMLSVVGPMGHGWTMPEDAKHALLVGVGMGVAPLVMLARELATRGVVVDMVLAARSSNLIIARDRIIPSVKASGGTISIATDDGSEGRHGFANQVSDPLVASGAYDYMCVCGPAIMEKVTVKAALDAGLRCDVSLERLMACGIGICLSCVVDTTEGRKRCCADGPVFDASEVIW